MNTFSAALWFAAVALAWACVDLWQVRAAAGGQPLQPLGSMVLVLYATLGATSGLILSVLVGRLPARLRPRDATMLAGVFTAFGALCLIGLLNFVYLPSIADPLTIAVNAGLALVAVALWWLLSRSVSVDRLARSGVAALATAAISIAAGLLIAGGSAATAPPQRDHAAGASPNVIVIVIDSLRYDRTAGGTSRTPQLDSFGLEGATFERAYAQSSWTKPSVASLFTSVYPAIHQANSRRGSLGAAVPTMPETFASAGYRTGVFSANPWIAPAFGFDRGVDHFYEADKETFARFVILLRTLKAVDRPLPGRPVTAALGHLQRLFALEPAHHGNCERDDAVVDALGDWLAGGSGPAFAYLHLMSPHLPYEPPAEFDTGGTGEAFASAEQVALLQSAATLSAPRAARLAQLYDASVRHADALLTRIATLLERAGMDQNSILVVTADHGEEFHEHGHWGHGKSLYDELVHVPLVMRGPGIPPHRLVGEPAMLIDVLPTLARLAGISPLPAWEGTDLRSLDAGRAAYAELIREGGFEAAMGYRDRTKIIETVDSLGQPSRVEIYDLVHDPGETKNVASQGGIGQALAGMLERRRGEMSSGRVEPAPPVKVDPATDERLKALGYLD